MGRRVLILDTSVLCCWLRVSGKEETGPAEDRWNHDRINKQISEEKQRNSILVLPIATLIETGNHIAQSPSNRFDTATKLAQCLKDAADAQTPWAAFTEQSPLWEDDSLRNLANSWPSLATSGMSIGDATIKDVAEYYAKAGYDVEILTADTGLKSYQPTSPIPIPRRRR
jgi:hypothetical protein